MGKTNKQKVTKDFEITFYPEAILDRIDRVGIKAVTKNITDCVKNGVIMIFKGKYENSNKLRFTGISGEGTIKQGK